MGQGKVCNVSWLSASLPRICNSVWQKYQKTWAVHESKYQGRIEKKASADTFLDNFIVILLNIWYI